MNAMTDHQNVTTSDYSIFLNATASTNTSYVYNEKMGSDAVKACIVCSGTVGNYFYGVIAGKENKTITFVNRLAAEAYINWLNNNNSCAEQDFMSLEDDLFLASNNIDFQITLFSNNTPSIKPISSLSNSKAGFIIASTAAAIIIFGTAFTLHRPIDDHNIVSPNHLMAEGTIPLRDAKSELDSDLEDLCYQLAVQESLKTRDEERQYTQPSAIIPPRITKEEAKAALYKDLLRAKPRADEAMKEEKKAKKFLKSIAKNPNTSEQLRSAALAWYSAAYRAASAGNILCWAEQASQELQDPRIEDIEAYNNWRYNWLAWSDNEYPERAAETQAAHQVVQKILKPNNVNRNEKDGVRIWPQKDF